LIYGKLNGTGTAFVFVVVADLLVAAVAKILAACTLDLGLGFLSGDGAIRAGACAGVSVAVEDDVLVVAVDGAVADDDDDDGRVRVLMTPSIKRDAPSSASASCRGRVVAFAVAVAFAFFAFSLSCHVQEHGIFFWVKKCRFP